MPIYKQAVNVRQMSCVWYTLGCHLASTLCIWSLVTSQVTRLQFCLVDVATIFLFCYRGQNKTDHFCES